MKLFPTIDSGKRFQGGSNHIGFVALACGCAVLRYRVSAEYLGRKNPRICIRFSASRGCNRTGCGPISYGGFE